MKLQPASLKCCFCSIREKNRHYSSSLKPFTGSLTLKVLKIFVQTCRNISLLLRFLLTTETCSLKYFHSMSAGFINVEAHFPVLFFDDRSDRKWFDHIGKYRASLLLPRCWRWVHMWWVSHLFCSHSARWCMCFHCVIATEKPTTGTNPKKKKYLILVPLEKQVCLPVSANRNTDNKVPMFTRHLRPSGRIREETPPLAPQTLKWTRTKHSACDVFLSFSLSLSLASCRPLCRSTHSPLRGQNLNLAANQKQYF